MSCLNNICTQSKDGKYRIYSRYTRCSKCGKKKHIGDNFTVAINVKQIDKFAL